MRRLPDAGHDNYYAITDKQSRVLLTAIRLLLDKFEPIGDDYRHGLWIEVTRETYWYYLSIGQYNGHTYLHISEQDMHWCCIHDDADWNHHSIGPLEWYLRPLVNFLKEKVADIVKDPEAYNRYVEEHLPNRQRGSVSRYRKVYLNKEKSHGDDEGIIDLPFVDDCDKPGELSREEADAPMTQNPRFGNLFSRIKRSLTFIYSLV